MTGGYETFVPLADRLYQHHLNELEEDNDHGKSQKLSLTNCGINCRLNPARASMPASRPLCMKWLWMNYAPPVN